MINIPLHKLLNILWGYKEFSVLSYKDPEDKNLLDQIKLEAKKEDCHLEEKDGGIVHIWRANEWEIEYRRRGDDKRDSEERIRKHEENKSLAEYLEDCIRKKLGDAAAGILGRNLAQDIIRTKNITMAEYFGASKERIGSLK